MNDRSDPRLVERLRDFASASAITSISIGLFVLAGWIFHVVALLTWGGVTPMSPNAAGCAVLAGISLWLSRNEDNRPFVAANRPMAKTAAGIVTLVGSLSLAEHLFNLKLGIDRVLLVTAATGQTAAARVLMSPVTAVFFVLLGVALLTIDWRTRRGDWPAQFLSMGALIGAAFGLFSSILAPAVSSITVSLPGVVSYLILASGLLSSRPAWAIGGLLVRQSRGASLLRRAVPAALLVLSLVGLSILRPLLTDRHFTWVEVSALGVLCSAMLAGFVIWMAFLVERSGAERERMEEALYVGGEPLGRLLDRIELPQDEKVLRRRAIVGFAVAVLLTILLSALSWRTSQQEAEDADWVAHTHKVSTTLELTLRHLDDVETGARGFALTGLESFLEPFGSGKYAVGQDLQALRLLLAANANQQRLLEVLVQQANARIEASSDLVAFRRSAGTLPTVAQLERGKELMDEVRVTFGKMEAEENRLLKERTQRAGAARRFNGSVIGLSLIFGIIFLTVAGITVSREIGISARMRAQVTALNADLERRVAERTTALGESEGRLAGIIASAMDAIITVDDRQRIVLFNSAAEKMFRCPAEEAMGQPVTRFIPSRFHADHPRHIENFAETGVTNRAMGPKDTLWALRADGEEFQIEASISQVVTGGKQLFTVILRDVTERVQAEQAVRDARARLDGIIASAMDSIITVDRQQRVVLFNEAAARTFRCSEAEALGQPIERFIPQRFRSAHAAHIRLFGETGTTSRAMGGLNALWAVRADGEEFQIEASISQAEIAGEKMFTVILRDVTERKQAEELRERLAAVVDSSDDAIISKDLNGTINAWNRGAEKIFGYPASEVLGKPMLMLFPPERVDEEAGILSRIRHGERVEHFETVLVRKDGARIDVSVTISPIRDSSGAIIGASKIASDVTERKRTEAALRESEANFSAVVNLAPQFVWICTNEGLNTYFNDRWFKYTGLTPEQSHGKGWNTPFHPDDKQTASDRWNHATATGETYSVESRLRAADGSYRWFLMRGEPVRDASGGIVKWFGTCTDIDEMKQAQDSLRESEDRFRLFAEHAPAALAMFDREMRYLHTSRRWRTDYGLGERELRGVSHYELFPEIPERWKEIHRRAMAGEVQRGEDDQLNRLDGSVQWIRWEVRPWYDRTDAIAGIVIFAEEITARKQAENALHDSEEKLRLAVEGARLGTWNWDLKTGELAGSPIAFALFGLPADTKFDFGIFLSTLHPDDRGMVDQAMKRTLAERAEYDVEYRCIRPDGTERWIAAKGHTFENEEGESVRVGGIVFDVTERRRALERLRENEELFQAMANGIPQLAWMAGADGAIFWYNQRWYEYTGTTAEQMQGWGWQSVHDPEVLPSVIEKWNGSIASGAAFEMEFPLRSADGHFGMFLTRVMPLKDSDGRVVRWFGTNTDISERKESEKRLATQAEQLVRSRQALEAQTTMLKLVLESIGEGLVAADRDGRFLLWNGAASKLLSREAANLPPEQWSLHYSCYLPDGITPCPTDRLPLVRALRGESLQQELIIQQPGSDDSACLEFSGRPMKDAQGSVCGGVVAFRDITERKRDEAEIRKLNEELERKVLQRTAQLEAANRELEAFTYSVSHDLRAPLRHIGSFSKILSEDFGSAMDPEARGLLGRIENGARHMTLLVDGLLTLSRVGPQSLKLSLNGLNPIVNRVISVLQPECEGREIEWRIAPLPAVECDPILMQQVFQNLLSNALKYSGRRAKAMIEVDSIQHPGKPPIIFVRDNGAGFDMRYANKLFGVFQRMHTDSEFEGTGVGLATVQRIIEKHGGSIWAEAEVDRGATFYFTVGEKMSRETTEKITADGTRDGEHERRR